MTEIFKYHVAVELTPLDNDAKYGPRSAEVKDVTMSDAEPKQQDVEMSEPSERDRKPPPSDRPLRKQLVRMVINAVLQQYEADFDGIRVVHDGMAAIYSPRRLPWDTKDFLEVNPDGPVSAEAKAQRKGRGPRTFSVKLKYVETINMRELTEYYTNPEANPMPALQALDVAARHLGAQRLIPVGRNFFSMKKTHSLRGGKELCWGYHQSIRITQKKLMLNMDQAATVFYAPGPLIELVLAALNARDARDVRHLSEREAKNLSRALRKIEIVTTHRVDRKKPINGISSQPVDATMIEIEGKEVSVADYFSQRYNVTLRFPNLPAVNIGGRKKPTYLPIEVCEVAPGQRCSNINDLDTAEIIRQTSQKPNLRQENIMDQVRGAGFENDPYLSAFGMKVELKMENLDARVLETPEVQYANISERPNMGSWNLRDRRFVEGASLRNWGVVIHANISERDVQRFIGTMCDVARKCAIDIHDTNPVIVHQDSHRAAQVEELMTICHRDLENRNLGPPQLIMVIKKDKTVGPYSDIKRMSDTVLGIPSQCIVAANVAKSQAQYCANVCMKINMKLNGKNSILRDHLPLVSSSPTMIIGANITHPRSGMGSRPSIASVVASLDRYSAKYVARVAAQKASNDISSLPFMLRDLFLAYYQATNRKPEHIVYYRDGVSDGQFYDILQTEMKALRKACMMMSEDFIPPVTFIVANKRHHMRGFGLNSRDCDRSGNIQPGTVIDTGIVDSHRFDFFLYGHSGIQGTSCPAHYTVLHDENNMSADDVQKLTYSLCYTFARCTRSVSVVPPVYYAQLAAARANFFLNEGSDGASTVGSGHSNSSNFDFSGLHKDLYNCMFYI
uniref:Piwi domain-containing protein n=1 Tax=Globisporangium ultimum (strain ATCC 200006 / CBS 805.95 / DAOM BR144) TaxID=431595 RepID=K3X8F2_GLOUD